MELSSRRAIYQIQERRRIGKILLVIRGVQTSGRSNLDECSIVPCLTKGDYSDGLRLAPATLTPNIGSGEAADIGASRRSNHSIWPFLARTPARPDWAKPGSETAR